MNGKQKEWKREKKKREKGKKEKKEENKLNTAIPQCIPRFFFCFHLSSSN